MKRRISTLLLMAFMIAVVGGAARAQEFRARITGRVHDSSDAVIVGAKVSVMNTETGATSVTRSSGEGTYTIPFLMPGTYSITVEAPKFQKYVHSGITLSLGALVTEDVLLKVGATADSVVVTAEAPLVDATTSSNGQVITTAQIEALPSNGRSPLGFVRHAYGVVPKGKNSTSQVRPFDNSAVSDLSLGGATAQKNEIMIDGVPNMGQSRVSTYSPMMDAVQEIKADGFMADASVGDTMGGTITMTTKSGTNKYHGTASWFNQYSGLAAKPHFQPKDKPVQLWRSNNYGATLGGPMIKNKLFFFFGFEGYKQSQPNPKFYTVPTLAERQGDFSELLKIDPAKYQLYDPFSGRLDASGHVVRTLIPENKLTNLRLPDGSPRPLNPISLKILQYIPLPNVTNNPNGNWTDNYWSDNTTSYNYSSYLGRLDYNQGKNSTFVKVQESANIMSKDNIFDTIATGTNQHTDHWGVTVDNIHTFSPTLFLDTRIGGSRSGGPTVPTSTGLNPTADLGFPSYFTANTRALALPQITFSESASTPVLSAKPIDGSPFLNLQYFGSLTKVWSRHTLKIGPEVRLNKWVRRKQDANDGAFTFGGSSSWMRANSSEGSVQTFGSAYASFLLGVPDSGKYTINRDATNDNWYYAFFVQDDWKIRRNLTINLGLRLEHETAVVESRNAAVIGFDPTASNQATVAAEAAYKANPVLAAYAQQFPGFMFAARGGLKFADANNRSPYSTPAFYFGPRVGVAWSPELFHDKLAVRAGFGIFNNTNGVANKPYDYGYSQTTTLSIPNDRLAPKATLSDPFPVSSNPILGMQGSSKGVNTNLGQDTEFFAAWKQPYSERWNLDIQYQLPKGWVAVIGYTGSHFVHLGNKNNWGSLPLQYLSRSRFKDQTLTNLLDTSVANPYAGLLPAGTGMNEAKVKLGQLLRPFAMYGGKDSSLVEQVYPSGWGNGHSLNTNLSKRFSNGMQLSAVYTFSRTLATDNPLNNNAGQPWYGMSTSDYPHHLSVTGIYQLPFGKGKKLLPNANKWADGVVGGWTLQGIFMYLSGVPITGWSNKTVYLGGPLHWNARNLQQAFDTTQFINVNTPTDVCKALDPAAFKSSCKDILPDANNWRTFPGNFGRADSAKNLDLALSKSFHIREHYELQYRFEAFNALNRTQFDKPNNDPTSTSFGKVTSQLNDSRSLQMGLRLAF